jgi:hypothetical protein
MVDIYLANAAGATATARMNKPLWKPAPHRPRPTKPVPCEGEHPLQQRVWLDRTFNGTHKQEGLVDALLDNLLLSPEYRSEDIKKSKLLLTCTSRSFIPP